jgi:hypothetical protein
MTKPRSTSRLDEHLRLRLEALDDGDFERFFLHFLNAGISLTVMRDGQPVERRIIEANTYAAGTGRKQKGIDLIAKVEGGETWAFQCKRHKTWTVSQTQKAITDATYPANHYFLLVACDPHKDVQDEMDKHPQWSFWNLDRICQEFRLRVPEHKQPPALYFLTPEELKRFAPYATDALVPAPDYFASIQGSGHSFHHNYPLVGRSQEMAQMEAFARDPKAKVLKISGKGGEGKSRLLWELAHTVCAKPGSPAVLFLNPHSTGDLTLALWDKDTPRIIVVDDAHRIERVSHELLSRVREAEATKLVLATRPQGNEVLDERLREHGFPPLQVLVVTALRKKDMMALATEALGPVLKPRAKDLVGLTGDSPFLTTLAGDLLRRGRLQWGDWLSTEEFRAAVFSSFETDNLDHLGEADRKQGARLLRVIALLAPATPDAVFHETAAKCLGIPKVDVEALLRRLQAAGIVSAENQNVRVIPDLFADFLVFDTAFDPKHRLPELAATVLQEFSNQAASLLRNLAEASWIAGVQALGREELLRPLLDAEFARFDASSFFERGRMLERWATFSVYLPGESLALAKKALTQKTAPAGATSLFDSGDEDGINSHRYVRSWIPTLLKPVVLWHDEHRPVALDFLWQLGIDTPRGMLNGGKNHPWSVIAEVVKFTPHKPIAIVDSALQWVERLVQRPAAREILVAQRAALSTLLEPCFERFVEFNEWQGRTMHWWTRPVDVQITAPLRTRAVAIIRQVIEQDSWRLALEGIGAAERALHRVAGAETSRVSQAEKFREEWRPERLKALALLPLALQKHPHTMVRFAIRQMLQRDLAYEEDPVFAVAVREVLASIPSDFGLRLVTAINTQGYYEFAEQMGAPIGEEAQDKIQERWKEYLADIAREFLRECPNPASMIACLDQVIEESLAAGHHPDTGELLAAVTEADPQRAAAFSAALLDPGCEARVAVIWHQVLYSLPASQAAEAERLLAIAAEHPRTDIRRGVVDYFRFRDRKEMALSPAERALLEKMAAKAGLDEIMSFVTLVQWVGPSCAEWGYELLRKLRLTDLPDELHGEVLAALNPYHARKVTPPLATVQHVLDALVKVPEIKVDHHGGGYERILKLYPRAIYDFVLQRASRYEKSGRIARYQAVPHDILARFQLEGLSANADFDKICGFLWEKMMGKVPEHMRYVWRELFQGIVLDRVDFWLPKLTAAVKAAISLKQLRELMEVIHFDGSLIVFFFPDFTKAVLERAEDLEGIEGYERMRTTLYVVSGPRSRSGTNGELDKDKDYVEAEAVKAATTHAADSILGPFYRWVVEVEQHEREQSRKRYQADIASLDEE